MLAVHQEEQEALYKHIQDILPDGRLPVSTQDYRLSSLVIPGVITFADLWRHPET